VTRAQENTERPETVEAGANVVAGVEPEGMLRSSITMMERRRGCPPGPFGDGHVAKRIVKMIEERTPPPPT
jgi:UDP-N-acetylglucosamine 2-epimerase (non-hydrolysing)